MTEKQEVKLQSFYKYKGKVIRVVDADTVDAVLDLGFCTKVEQRFRIDGFDAPETWRPRNEAEAEHGEQATKRAIELLVGKTLIFITSKTAGIYGRYGAKILLDATGNDYAQVMINEGFEKKDNYGE